jgi:microcystin degradation protein MlrC
VRIFAAGIATETNTFSAIPTGLEDFIIQRGRDVLSGFIDYPWLNLWEPWGRRATLRGDEFAFSLMASAEPAGTTLRAAYECLRDEIFTDLRAALPVDVVLLMLHGAMVAHGYEDCEEDIIRRIREIVGSDTVIGVELDLHCHLSQSKIEEADLVITYKEYPHIDSNSRAEEVFDLAIATALGSIRPTTALFDCLMVGLYPTTREPMRSFVNEMIETETRPGVLSVSFGHGFQFADLPHVGAKVLVTTNGDHALAEQVAAELGMRVHALRRQIGFDSLSLPIDQALSKAISCQTGPVVVADQSDNTGGGAPGDSTFALRWLLDHKVADAALAIMYDPQVVKLAKKVGEGATLLVRLGGKTGPLSGDPVDIQITVLSIIDNYMHIFPQAFGDPLLFPAGDVAALRCGSIDIVVSSERCQCFDPSIFLDLGIDPAAKRLLIVKSVQHFHGAFLPIAAEIIYMSAPGAVPPDPRLTEYYRLNTSRLYPWAQHPLGS